MPIHSRKLRVMIPGKWLGVLFLTPATLFVVVFFVAPVLLTAVFAFTSMSTATGIGGGGYLITPSTLSRLAGRGMDRSVVELLGATSYLVNPETLARARAAGVAAGTLDELEQRHAGKPFDSRRNFERALKSLNKRPRSVRALKQTARHFETSVVNRTFRQRADLLTALAASGLQLSDEDRERLVRASYTGWAWTTDNLRRMFGTADTAQVLANTLIYVFVTLILFNTGFALVLAVTTFYLPATPAAVFRGIWFLPRITPPVLYVLLWKWLAWDTGFLSTVLVWFGVASRNWMLDTAFNAWVFVVLINGFVGASMGMIIFSSAIRAIPKTLFWASEVDGASRWQQVRRIILPQLRWPILFVTSYQTLSLLTSFEYILLATDGGPGSATEVWSLAAYHTALNNYAGNLQYGYGATLALVLVIIGVAFSLLYLKIFNFDALVARPRIET